MIFLLLLFFEGFYFWNMTTWIAQVSRIMSIEWQRFYTQYWKILHRKWRRLCIEYQSNVTCEYVCVDFMETLITQHLILTVFKICFISILDFCQVIRINIQMINLSRLALITLFLSRVESSSSNSRIPYAHTHCCLYLHWYLFCLFYSVVSSFSVHIMTTKFKDDIYFKSFFLIKTNRLLDDSFLSFFT